MKTVTQPATAEGHASAQEPAAVVNEYLAAFYAGDFDRARSVVADDFGFSGPFVQVQGSGAFFASAEGLRAIVRGHRLLRQWVAGEDVSSVYEVKLESPVGAAVLTMSEWHVVRGDRVAQGLVLFDPAALRALLPQP